MGESKVPLFAYVDETGNTGHNLFDEAQPDFFAGSLITKGDFDARYKQDVLSLAKMHSENALHGQKLGVGRIEVIAPHLLKILIASEAIFFMSRVEKKYLLCTKMFDALFDSGENAAVAWHHYNLRASRLMLVFKLSVTIDIDTAKLFWQSILEPKEDNALKLLPEVCDRLLENLVQVPDARSREVLGQGLNWARENPEAIQIYADRQTSKHGHFPNLVAFANLLDGLEMLSTQRKRKISRIKHDQQSEFEQTLKAWHELFSNASPEELKWAGESYKLQKVVGSQFEVFEDSESPGIQITDVILWLYSQFRKGKTLPAGCQSLVDYSLLNGWENDFSFDGVERSFMEKFGPALSKPLTPELEAAARDMLHRAEKNRLASMAQYQVDKLPPFERSSMKEISDKQQV
jgi:Protein of unknown function (DUF3800)